MAKKKASKKIVKKASKKKEVKKKTVALKDMEKFTEEELLASAEAYHEEFTTYIKDGVLPELKHLLGVLMKAIPCKQYQLCIMDVESMSMHLADLQESGPETALQEREIDESEEQEEFQFAGDELEYEDDEEEE